MRQRAGRVMVRSKQKCGGMVPLVTGTFFVEYFVGAHVRVYFHVHTVGARLLFQIWGVAPVFVLGGVWVRGSWDLTPPPWLRRWSVAPLPVGFDPRVRF